MITSSFHSLVGTSSGPVLNQHPADTELLNTCGSRTFRVTETQHPGPVSVQDEVYFKRFMCRCKSQPKHFIWSWAASLPVSWKLFVEDELIRLNTSSMRLQDGWTKNSCSVLNKESHSTSHVYRTVFWNKILECFPEWLIYPLTTWPCHTCLTMGFINTSSCSWSVSIHIFIYILWTPSKCMLLFPEAPKVSARQPF